MPTYLAIGMSCEEFWHGDLRLAKVYRDAEKIKRDNRYLAEWRAGIYIYEALLAASPAYRELSQGIDHKYPEKPLFQSSTKSEIIEDKNKDAMQKNKAAFLTLAAKLNKQFIKSAQKG